MKIVIPGGTGQVGTFLAHAFVSDGHDVVVLGRTPEAAECRVVKWDGKTLGDWANEIEGSDVVMNLAGRSVNCRYSPDNRRQIIDSRVNSTKVVGEAIAQASNPPKVWLQASTATIYAHRFDAPNDELTGIIGGTEPDVPATWSFSIDVAKRWEQAAMEADVPKTRRVLMRSAITFSPDRGGIFDVLLGLVRRGLGGTAGNGRQYVSWIHDRDFIKALYWLIEHEEMSGPMNIAAPNPLPNAEFMRVLREAWGISIGLAAPEWMLEIGAFLMRSETELILKSRRVLPAKLLDAGFSFDFPDWSDAARDLCKRSREQKYSSARRRTL